MFIHSYWHSWIGTAWLKTLEPASVFKAIAVRELLNNSVSNFLIFSLNKNSIFLIVTLRGLSGWNKKKKCYSSAWHNCLLCVSNFYHIFRALNAEQNNETMSPLVLSSLLFYFLKYSFYNFFLPLLKSLLFMHVCVWVYLSVCVWMCICTYVCKDQKIASGRVPQKLSNLFVETESLIGLELAKWCRLAGQ